MTPNPVEIVISIIRLIAATSVMVLTLLAARQYWDYRQNTLLRLSAVAIIVIGIRDILIGAINAYRTIDTTLTIQELRNLTMINNAITIMEHGVLIWILLHILGVIYRKPVDES